jgi:hypothetical protein
MPVPDSSLPLPRTSVIAAVGRSGTTILHRLLLQIYADNFGDAFDILYEPFVWDAEAIGRYPMDKARERFQGPRSSNQAWRAPSSSPSTLAAAASSGAAPKSASTISTRAGSGA